MTRPLRPRPREMNELMDFDHVVTVHADGRVTDGPAGLYAPELCHEDLDQSHGSALADWQLMTGWTGQDRYNGPCMHDSEFIGERMGAFILANPGHYVVTTVEVLDCEECESACHMCEQADVTADLCEHGECGGEHEPAGWAVAYIPTYDDLGDAPDCRQCGASNAASRVSLLCPYCLPAEDV